MILPIPSGTRDVLPDEMGELRTLTERLRAVFSDAGYGEVYTPALEYERRDHARRARRRAAGLPGVRRERRGARAALGHDRADRAPGRRRATRPPSRRCASPTSRTATAVFARSAGQPREFLQAGIELVGAPAPAGPPRP